MPLEFEMYIDYELAQMRDEQFDDDEEDDDD